MTKPLAGILFALFLFLPFSPQAQEDSCDLTISLLTATPGEELYSTFGHSALRVTDRVNHTDIVYNYGTFNFDEPGFYTKFIRGKLMYYLSTEDYPSFMYMYELEGRGIAEQVLNLNCQEKRKIRDLLSQNLLPGNRYYKYDFLFDNCTTRLRDLIEETDTSVHFAPVLSKPRTFRNLIHSYLNSNHKWWSKLGIDLLLGSRTDAVMTPHQVMFLPDFLMKTLDSSTIQQKDLVKEKQNILAAQLPEDLKNNLTTPIFIFSCLFAVIAFLSFFKSKAMHEILLRFDSFLFFITGLLGILFLFMWFGTDHIMTKANYNLLWAWPTNVVFAFFLRKTKRWVFFYLCIYATFSLIVLALWFLLPQQLNPAIIPIMGILIFRSYINASKKRNTNETANISR